MTMMATQEPIDPSVLLSHNNNNNSTNNDTTTSLKEATTDNDDDDDPSSELCTSLSAPSSSGDNGEIGNTTNSKTTIPITTSVTTKISNSSSNGYNDNNNNAMSRTPPRSSLATDPSLTPIASIKRPRANLNKSNSDLTGSSNSANRTNHNTATAMLMSPKTPKTPHSSSTMTPTTTTRRSSSAIESSTPLSPMHKIKPVLHRETVNPNNNNSVSTTTSLNTNTQSSSSSPSEYQQQNSSKEIIKDKVEELFSPVVQFLHEHEEHGNGNIQQQPHSTTTNSISEDQSFNELDHHNHYNTNTEDDDDDAVLQEEDNVNVDDIDVDDDDESMSRPEQHDDITNEGEFNPWQFIASLPPYDTVACHRPPITLPPLTMTTTSSSLFDGNKNHQQQQLRKTLVLDLDETLVHCSVTEPMDHIVDFTFPVQFHGETYSVHVKCRPYLYEFLNEMSQHFEIIVFTASQKVYADALLNIIDPDGRCIHHRLFRESCLAVEGNYLKDLNVLGRDLRHTVLVDNSPHAFGYQVSNGIPIESWFDCPNDRELIKLQRFLLSHILPADDVRIPVRNKFQSHVLIESASPFQH